MLRTTFGFHQDSYYAYTKVHKLTPWRPPAMAVAGLLGLRCLAMIGLQMLRPTRTTSSGGRN